jgi:hypothetical protein
MYTLVEMCSGIRFFFCDYQRYVSLVDVNIKKSKNQIVIEIKNLKFDSAPTLQNFFPARNQPSVIQSVATRLTY